MNHGIDQASHPPQHGGYGVIEDVHSVTDVVLRAMSRTPNPRLREVMESFVRHVHAMALNFSSAGYRIRLLTPSPNQRGAPLRAVGMGTQATAWRDGRHQCRGSC
jgi:hypothetical protein